jgi:chromate transporter
VIVLARRTVLHDGWYPEMPKVALLLITIVVLVAAKKVPEPLIILGAAIAGMVLYPMLQN